MNRMQQTYSTLDWYITAAAGIRTRTPRALQAGSNLFVVYGGCGLRLRASESWRYLVNSGSGLVKGGQRRPPVSMGSVGLTLLEGRMAAAAGGRRAARCHGTCRGQTVRGRIRGSRVSTCSWGCSTVGVVPRPDVVPVGSICSLVGPIGRVSVHGWGFSSCRLPTVVLGHHGGT